MVRTLDQTVGSQLRAYLRSARLRTNAVAVQKEYARVAGHLDLAIGATPLAEVDRSWLREQRDGWSENGHRAATIRLQVLKNALEPLMSDGVIDRGLFIGLQRVNRPHGRPEQNLAWTDDEVGEVLASALINEMPGLARAIGLARYAGLRRQTICSITEDERYIATLPGGDQQRRIRYKSAKGEVWADIPEDSRLTRLLEDTHAGPHHLAYSRSNDPWKPRRLNYMLGRVLEELATSGLVRPKLTLHGLRHARGVELALAGASDAELMAQLAHADEQSAKVYRRQAARGRLADHGQRLVDQHLIRMGLCRPGGPGGGAGAHAA